MKLLTEKQKQLLNFVTYYIEKHQSSPSYSEIQKHFGFASLSSVYKYLQTLCKMGFLHIDKKPASWISLPKTTKKGAFKTYYFPLLGFLNDEGEIENISKIKKIPYGSSKRFSSNCYVLKVKGGNYLEAGLLHEDLILVEPRGEAIAGETVIANIYSEQLVIKKYSPNGPYVRLDSFCMQVEPMIIVSEECAIHGVILGVIRKYAI